MQVPVQVLLEAYIDQLIKYNFPVAVASMTEAMVKLYCSEEAHVVETSPLQDLDILKHIISFVGANQYRFTAAVSKNFKAFYL
jgi:hypothetical protein